MSHNQSYVDERFQKALASLRYKTTGPWILALPREDLDPSSCSTDTSHVEYKLNAKVDQIAVMHVLAKGRGRVRLGFREHIPVDVGDLVLVNLREAGHWITIGGHTFYLFTSDVAFARMYRTAKPKTAPQQKVGEADEAFKERRLAWMQDWFWNIRDVLNDYVLLGRDPEAERKMQNGPETLLHIPGHLQSDGVRSDNQRDNRFPIVYRRVLGAGPGRWLTRESDLGMVEREETKYEGEIGGMMAMCKTVQAASFIFQGAPFQVCHASSAFVIEARGESVSVHQNVPQPIPWVDPDDTPEDEDPEAQRAEA
jgi:hypothetical protein